MPFGMKNSAATFQRLVNNLIFNLDGCIAFIDYAIIFSEEWQQHLQIIRTFFDRLSEAKLTVNLAKCEFCHANLTFLGLPKRKNANLLSLLVSNLKST